MLSQWADTHKIITLLKNFSKMILFLDHDIKTLVPFLSLEKNNDNGNV